MATRFDLQDLIDQVFTAAAISSIRRRLESLHIQVAKFSP